MESIPEEIRSENWWIVLCDGTPVAGNHGGGVTLLVEIRLTRIIGYTLRTLRLSPIIDALDKFLDRIRAHIGWMVPEGPGPRRYP
ncbi:MAG: hypothetical protein FVQ83_04420 [Chloroflexi bacterium]|nr:hypothetical protein [Chloroflexota bacterium]